jgi:hypothetical protein
MDKYKEYYNFGYHKLWEILYWFCYFIFEETIKSKAENIFFSSRDGLNFLPLLKLIYNHNKIDFSNLKPILLSRKMLLNFLDWEKNNIDKYLRKNFNKKNNIIVDIWYKWTSHKYLKQILNQINIDINFQSLLFVKHTCDISSPEVIWYFSEDMDSFSTRILKRNAWWLELILWDYNNWSISGFTENLLPIFLWWKITWEQAMKHKIMFDWVIWYFEHALENNINLEPRKELLNKSYEIFCLPSEKIVNLFKDFIFADEGNRWKKWEEFQLKIFNNNHIWTITNNKWKVDNFDIWYRNPWIWWKMTFDNIALPERKLYHKKIFKEEITIVWGINWESDLDKVYHICK